MDWTVKLPSSVLTSFVELPTTPVGIEQSGAVPPIGTTRPGEMAGLDTMRGLGYILVRHERRMHLTWTPGAAVPLE
jgi:hypothetical protein